MKISKKKLRTLIREEIHRLREAGLPDFPWDPQTPPVGAFGLDDPEERDIQNDYDAIQFIDDKLGDAIRKLKVNPQELNDALHNYQGSVAELLTSVLENIRNVRPDAYTPWPEVALMTLADQLGVKVVKPDPIRDARRIVGKARWIRGTPKDLSAFRGKAAAKLAQLMQGEDYYFEEQMDDVIPPRLMGRLAKASGMDVITFGDKLADWWADVAMQHF